MFGNLCFVGKEVVRAEGAINKRNNRRKKSCIGGVNPYKVIDLNLKEGVSIRVCKGLSEGKIGYAEPENHFPFLL